MHHALLSNMRKRHQAYQRLFCGEEGILRDAARSVLNDLAVKCGAKGAGKGTIPTSFVAGDPYQTAFNEGKRYLFHYILHYLNLTHHDFNLYFQEYDHDDRPSVAHDH